MEWKLFEGDAPVYTTPEWYQDRERADHLANEPHTSRLRLAERFVMAAVNNGARSVVDLGCGDGGLLSCIDPWMRGQIPYGVKPPWGYDLMPENVEAGQKVRKVDVRYGDFVNGEIEWADAAICTEVLEHLIDPHSMVRRIAEHCEYLIASSPYVETYESHYAFHTFCWNVDGYKALLEQGGFRVLETELVDQFQVHLAQRDNG